MYYWKYFLNDFNIGLFKFLFTYPLLMEIYNNFNPHKHTLAMDNTINYPASNYYSNTIPTYSNDSSFQGQLTGLNKDAKNETNNLLNQTYKGPD